MSDEERRQAAAQLEAARQKAAADLAAAQEAQRRLAQALAQIPPR
ncbi:hypothetical protein ABZ348_30520 [Streptomyces sp. NPDC005963]